MPRQQEEKHEKKTIRVAILAEEPLGWGSGKHYFPIILDNYSWTVKDTTYVLRTSYLFDKDILQGRLKTSEYDVLLAPGGGVGDGLSVMKGFSFLGNAKRWKQHVARFIKEGGGYVGICGGSALMTDLKTGKGPPRSLLERLYNKSSLGVSCVSSYYHHLAFPLFYPFQRTHPENVGAIAYVFSFAPGETTNKLRIHTGGAPIDFPINSDHPIFADISSETLRLRWWGGPGLIVPEARDRDVRVLATYPAEELSSNPATRIYAWRYTGGFSGLARAFLKGVQFIKAHREPLRNVFLYTYFFAGDWELTDKTIELDYSHRPSITAEIYPNKNKARILLCTAHPEYMIWQGGHIHEMDDTGFVCLGTGLHKWEDVAPIDTKTLPELTNSWWMVRRFTAWAAKVPDDMLPPLQNEQISHHDKSVLMENILWDGSLRNQMENI